jgi:uncharacterized protein YyaL (SSP411 family)
VVVHDPDHSIGELATAEKNKQMQTDQVTAYICENFSCQAPTTDLQQFAQALQKTTP